MPIRRDMRGFYPIDWRELSHSIRFRRAKGRCDHCRRPHGLLVCASADGVWWDEAEGLWRDGRGRPLRTPRPAPADLAPDIQVTWTRVWLACAHLDHDTANNASSNLAALCQRCHLNHDRPEHGRRRRQRWMASKAIGDLFTGPYRET